MSRRPKDASFRISLTAIRDMHNRLLAAVNADPQLRERIQLLCKGSVWVLDTVVEAPMQPNRLREVYTAIAKLQEVQDIVRRERQLNERSAIRQGEREASLTELRSLLERRRNEVAANSYFMNSGAVTGYYLQLLKTPVPVDADERKLKHYTAALDLAESKIEQFTQQVGETTIRLSSTTPRRRAEQLARKRSRTPAATNASVSGKKNKQ